MEMNPELTGEELLLIGLCRLHTDRKQREDIRFLAEKVTDWNHFSMLANRHGVASLVYHNLRKAGITSLIPEEVTGFLRNASMLSIARNAAIYKMIAEVAGILHQEGIRIVFLKGLALEMTVYANRGTRQMGDADIFVPSVDIMKAYKILSEKGFEFLPVKSVFYKSIIRYTGKHLPSLISNGLSVDMHCRLIGRDDEWFNKSFQDNCIEKEIEGIKVLIPSPLFHFIFLLHHLHSHELRNESQIRMYTDLAVLIEKYPDEILNSSLTDLSDKLGMNEVLASKLMILRDFHWIALPVFLCEFIERWKNERTMVTFLKFLKNTGERSDYDRPGFYRRLISEMPGFHRKVLYILGDIFPTLDFMKERYGCRTKFQAMFYYPHRLGKIFWLLR